MNSNEFIRLYWAQYISLEKEFRNTINYLALDDYNKNAYSQAFAKLLLEIGSEIDVVSKEYCKILDPNVGIKCKSIDDYRECITNNDSTFAIQAIAIKNQEKTIVPWERWATENKNPFWWKAYNTVKHNRTGIETIDGVEQDCIKFANQKYVLLALAGLFQIMVCCYYKLASDEKQKIVTPMPGSRLFEMTGSRWDEVLFYGDDAFYLDNGDLYWETSLIPYY